MRQTTVAIIGAGPAGLTAAYLLSKQDVPVTVLEADPEYVGGISRTAKYKGFHFDIGGHRFFSKSKEVEDLWTEILPDDMLDRPRSSRIFYNGQFFAYPLKAGEALTKLGVVESARCVLSYLKARAFPHKNPKSFQDWVTNQFGARLFNIFFKTYTEKVWGMSCKEISADWAAQRIKGLSLKTAILNALWKPKPQGQGRGHQDADRHLPLPAARPRDAVGGVRREDQGAGRRDRDGPQGGRAALRPGAAAVGGQPRRAERRLRADRGRARHHLRADAAAGAGAVAARLRRGAGRGRQAALPRLPDGGADPQGPRPVHGQLDLHPRPQREGRPRPELQVVVPGDGAGPVAELLRAGVLLLRGRRPVDGARRGPGRAGEDGAGEDRAGEAGGRARRLRGPAAEGVPGLRRRLRGERGRGPAGAGGEVPEPAPGRPQRHAQVQQPGPRDDDGDAVRGEHPGRPAGVRPVGGQPGRRVPRGRPGRRDRAAGGADAGEGGKE